MQPCLTKISITKSLNPRSCNTRILQFRYTIQKKLSTKRNIKVLKPQLLMMGIGNSLWCYFPTTSTWNVPGIRDGLNSPAFLGANSPVGK